MHYVLELMLEKENRYYSAPFGLTQPLPPAPSP